MTEPSQYFKGRTVQEQMDEVIGYVDKRAEEVAAAKADDVLQPAEAAKTAAQAAAEAAEAAKDATIAALPAIQQDISGLKAEDVALDGRLDTVELKVQTAEGNIVTIQGQIVALQNVQGDYVKKDGAAQTVTSQIMVPTTATGIRDTQIANGTRIQNDLDAYEAMVRDTGNKHIAGIKTFEKPATLALHESGSNNQNGWRKLFISPSFATSNEENGVTFELISNTGHYGLFSAFGRNGSLSNVVRRAGNFPVSNVKMSIDANNEVIVWSFSYRTIGIVNIEAHAGNNVATFADSGTTATFPEPTIESYRQVITATE